MTLRTHTIGEWTLTLERYPDGVQASATKPVGDKQQSMLRGAVAPDPAAALRRLYDRAKGTQQLDLAAGIGRLLRPAPCRAHGMEQPE